MTEASLHSTNLIPQPPRPMPQASGANKWLPGLQLAYSLVAALIYIGVALSLGLVGLVQQINASDATPTRMISLGWSAGLIGVLLLPAAVLAIFSLSSRNLPGWLARLLSFLDRASLFLILVWPVVLLIGYLAARLTSLNWLIMPPFNVLAVGIPVIWLLAVGRRRLPAGSPLRHWGVFSIGVVITPLLAFIIELIALTGLAVVVFAILALNPDLAAGITRFGQRLMLSQGDPETITRILRPILAQPLIIFGGLAVMSGLIPIIEELLKPLPVWLLGKRLTTPAEGFVAGLIGGAGFTLAESLGASSSFEPNVWLTVTFARAGTDLLHILNAGLMGWAIVCALRQGKYLRLGLIFLLVVAIHGLWNFFSLWAGFYSLIAPAPQDLLTIPNSELLVSSFGLSALFLVMLAMLILRNANLRRELTPAIAAEAPVIAPFVDAASASDPVASPSPESDNAPGEAAETDEPEPTVEAPAPPSVEEQPPSQEAAPGADQDQSPHEDTPSDSNS